MTDLSLLPAIVISTLIAYLLGALPVAAWVSRRRGVDIFSVGTGLPGAANVRRNVGNLPGGLVVLGDLAKGMISIAAPRLAGIEGLWLLLPCFFLVLGHWKSIFTGFRGGDGITPLGGAIIAMFEWTGFVAAVIAVVVTLGGQKLPYTSLLGSAVGVAVLIWLVRSFGSALELPLALGVGVIAALVLLHAAIGHHRRNIKEDSGNIDDLDGPENATRSS